MAIALNLDKKDWLNGVVYAGCLLIAMRLFPQILGNDAGIPHFVCILTTYLSATHFKKTYAGESCKKMAIRTLPFVFIAGALGYILASHLVGFFTP